MDNTKLADGFKPQAFEQQPLPFPIQAAPPIVRAHGLRDTHAFPLVARAKGESFRVSPLQAWHFLLLEIRAGNSYPLLTLDCDGPESVQAFWLAQLNSQLPETSWIVQNPATGNLQPSGSSNGRLVSSSRDEARRAGRRGEKSGQTETRLSWRLMPRARPRRPLPSGTE